MTDEISREEFEALKARVVELEGVIDKDGESPTQNEQNGLDHRDAAVVASLKHGTGYFGSQLKRKYMQETDIRQEKTAKRRAKTLTQKDCFKSDGRKFIYRGE